MSANGLRWDRDNETEQEGECPLCHSLHRCEWDGPVCPHYVWETCGPEFDLVGIGDADDRWRDLFNRFGASIEALLRSTTPVLILEPKPASARLRTLLAIDREGDDLCAAFHAYLGDLAEHTDGFYGYTTYSAGLSPATIFWAAEADRFSHQVEAVVRQDMAYVEAQRVLQTKRGC